MNAFKVALAVSRLLVSGLPGAPAKAIAGEGTLPD